MIRQATREDVVAIVANTKAMALETNNKTLSAEIGKWISEAIEGDPAHFGRYFVIVRNHDVIGHCIIQEEPSDWNAGFYLKVLSAFVRPDQRRSGDYQKLASFIDTADD